MPRLGTLVGPRPPGSCAGPPAWDSQQVPVESVPEPGPLHPDGGDGACAAAVERLEHRLEEWMCEMNASIRQISSNILSHAAQAQGPLAKSRTASMRSLKSNGCGSAKVRRAHMSLSSNYERLQQLARLKASSSRLTESMCSASGQDTLSEQAGASSLMGGDQDEGPGPVDEADDATSCGGIAPSNKQNDASAGSSGQEPQKVDSKGVRFARKSASFLSGLAGMSLTETKSPTPSKQADLKMRWLRLKGQSGHAVSHTANAAMSPFFAMLATSRCFINSILAAVILNVLLIAAQVQHEAVSGEHTLFFVRLEYSFVAVFTFEQLVNFVAFGCSHLRGRDKYWNIFDLLIVLISWAEIAVALSVLHNGNESASGTVGQVLRIPRIAKVLRLCRTARFLSSLRLMISLIMKSMKALFWVMVVILGILFVFSLLLTQSVTEHIRSASFDLDAARLEGGMIDCFGSLFLTMYSLSQAMTGGRNWGEFSRMLAPVGWDAIATIVVFIFFTAFSVVNIVTGVFVDGAIEMSKLDKTLALEKTEKRRSETACHLLELLIEMDSDGDGTISAEEFMIAIKRPDVQDFLAALQITIGQASNLFKVLDMDGDGTVDLIEFVDGMTLLKGEAKSSDIQILLMQVRQMISMLDAHLNAMGAAGSEVPPNGSAKPPDKGQHADV